MTTYVLVHGMWHGGWCWKKVRRILETVGHKVFTPTLTGCGDQIHLKSLDIDFNTHVQDIVQLLKYEDLQRVVLCGHSYGVFVVMAVAGEVTDRLASLVCLDGPLPVNGQACKDMFPQAYAQFRELALAEGDKKWVSAPADWTFGITEETDWAWVKSKLTTFPLKTWETPLVYKNPNATLQRVYIECVNNRDANETSVSAKYWEINGWLFRALATGHDAMVTQPQQLANLLLELA